ADDLFRRVRVRHACRLVCHRFIQGRRTLRISCRAGCKDFNSRKAVTPVRSTPPVASARTILDLGFAHQKPGTGCLAVDYSSPAPSIVRTSASFLRYSSPPLASKGTEGNWRLSWWTSILSPLALITNSAPSDRSYSLPGTMRKVAVLPSAVCKRHSYRWSPA